jgi:2-enoate reductase
MKKFETLFQPVTIGKLTIKNRLAMAPIVLFGMPLYNHQLQSMTRDGVEYYARRAKGGVGQIITSGFKVPHDVEQPGWPELRPEGLTALSEMVDLCHTYDCKVFIQLTPGTGRNLMPSQLASGLKPVSSSALPSVWDPDIICRAITTEEVKTIIDSYRPAAEMVAVTGIDGIEVHSHEGYLLDQFITSFYNRRTDEYGGSFENRMRLPIDILHVIRGTLGDDFPVTFRLGIKHFIKDIRVGAIKADGYEEKGRDIDDTHRIINRLEEEGYDGFHIDAGCYDAWFWAHPPIYMGHGPHLDYMKGVKDVVRVPVITANRLGLPEVAEKVVKEGLADIVAVGRALLSDPDFPKKLERGDPEDIRPCIGCHDGCFGHVINLARGLSCSVGGSFIPGFFSRVSIGI